MKPTTSILCTALLAGLPNVALQAQSDQPTVSTSAAVQSTSGETRAVQTEAKPQSGRRKEVAQAQVGVAPTAPVPPAPPGVYYTDRLKSLARRGSGSVASLLVPGAELSSQDQANLQEDLAVMSHLLSKTLGEQLGVPNSYPRALGVDVFFNPFADGFQSLYLDGYGALFLLNVSFPLVAPATAAETKEETAKDSAWQRAKEELYGSPEDRNSAAPAEEYNEQKVNGLKSMVLEALKNAANIRQLKAEDYVTVCVTGSSVSGQRKGRAAGYRTTAGDGFELLANAGFGRRSGPSSQLTIRVKKADADAFAKGKLNLEEFRGKAQVVASAGALGGSESGGTAGAAFGGSRGGNAYGEGKER